MLLVNLIVIAVLAVLGFSTFVWVVNKRRIVDTTTAKFQLKGDGFEKRTS